MQTESNIEQSQSVNVQSGYELEKNPEPSNTAQTAAKPDYFPQELWDNEKGQPKVEDVYKKLKESEKKAEGLRKVLGDKKLFEEYKTKEAEELNKNKEEEKYELNEELVKENLKEGSLNKLIEIAKKNNLNNNQFNELCKDIFIEEVKEQEEFKKAELEKLGPDAKEIIHNIENFLTAKLNSKFISEGEHHALVNIIDAGGADGMRAFAKIIEMTGEKSIPISVRSVNPHGTLNDLKLEYREAIRNAGGQLTPEVAKIIEKIEQFHRNSK